MKVILFLLCILGPCGGYAEEFGLTPAPGPYHEDLSIQWKPIAGWSLSYQFEGQDRFIQWPGNILLSALPGEKRTYRIRLEFRSTAGDVRTQEVVYVIDHGDQTLPRASLLPGIYTQNQILNAELRGWTLRDDQGKKVTLPKALEAPEGGVKEFQFTLAKEGSSDRTWWFRIDRMGQEAPNLAVVSPLAGAWANGQLVCLDVKGCDRVTWSTQEEAHPEGASPYTGPFLWKKKGPVQLFFFARSRATGQWITQKVSFSVDSEEPGPWPESRWSAVPPEGPALGPDWQISWNGVRWESADVVWKPSLPTSRLNYTVVLLKKKDYPLVYRYVYALDDTPAGVPRVQFQGGFDRRVWAWGPENQWLQPEWQGISPENRGQIQRGPLAVWDVPSGATGVKIYTLASNGRTSPGVSVDCPLSSVQPEWEPWIQASRPYGGQPESNPFLTAVYETSMGTDVAFPQESSPPIPHPLMPTLPLGDARLFSYRMAWRDETGRIGPSTAVFSVQINHIPPAPVKAEVVEGKIILSSEGSKTDPPQIFYALSSQPMVPGEPVNYLPYQQSLDFPQGSLSTGVFLQAYSQDLSGNTSPLVINQKLETDQKIFQITGYEDAGARPSFKLENGGVYGRNYVLLRPLTNIPGISLFYTLTENGDSPEDVRTKGLPYLDPLKINATLGTRKTIRLAWNAQKDGEWLWKEPRTLTFTLDLGAPGDPRLTNQAPGKSLDSPWKIGIERDSPGDEIFYTYTTDGSSPADPWGPSAEKAGKEIVLDVPEGNKAEFRLRLGVRSASGLGRELAPLGPVIVDRQTPAKVTIRENRIKYVNTPFTLGIDGHGFLVRYTQTLDDAVPGFPDRSSAAVPEKGLVLEGQEGKRLVYHLRFRGFTTTEKGGEPSEVYSVIVDRTGSVLPQTQERATPGQKVLAPQFKALPETALSSSPVTLPAQPGFHFEVAEGTNYWPLVGPQSAEWNQPITLDPGENQDRTYWISARAFDQYSAPAGKELHWQIRIDRIKPAQPVLKVVLEKNHNAFSLAPVPPSDEETLHYFYRWSWKSFPAGEGQTDWLPLGATVRCAVPGDLLSHAHAEVYAVDPAGNSSVVWKQDFLLDQNVVYLNSGTQIGDGSRSNPFTVWSSAVDAMRKTGRKTLFVASGSYRLDQVTDLTDFEVWAGWDSNQWEEGSREGRSKVEISPQFSGPMAFIAGKGTLQVRNLDVQSSGKGETLWYLQETLVIAENCQWSVKEGFPAVWTQKGGQLTWKNISGNLSFTTKARFLDLKDSEFKIQILNVASQQNSENRTLVFERSKGLISDVSLSNQGNSGLETHLLAKECEITGTGLRLETKSGQGWASGIQLDGSRGVFWKTDIRLQARRGSTGVKVSGGKSEWEGLSLFLSDGEEFNLGLVADQTDLNLRYADFRIASADYQSALVQTGGSLDIQSSGFILTGGTKTAWGGQFYQNCLVRIRSSLFELLNPSFTSVCWSLEKNWNNGSVETDNSFKGWKSLKEIRH